MLRSLRKYKQLLSYLYQDLKSGEKVSSTICEGASIASSATVQKAKSSSKLPVLTFYTKTPCHLCDLLMAALQPYKHRLFIQKVDITKKENLKWLKLYRHDIPVLHLEGEFLCKHKLDVDLLAAKLRQIEKSTNLEINFNRYIG